MDNLSELQVPVTYKVGEVVQPLTKELRAVDFRNKAGFLRASTDPSFADPSPLI